jgi:uncharacterized protein YndB with AHSA1/START domain
VSDGGLGTLRDDDGLRAVRFERLFDATPAELWRALTDPEEIGGWLAHASRWTLEPGGEYRLEFAGDAVTTGTVRAVEPGRLLELSWRYPGEPDSVLRLEIVPQEHGVKLVLDHRRLPVDATVGYGAGWQAHLEALERLLTAAPAGDADAWWRRYEELRPAYERLAAGLP